MINFLKWLSLTLSVIALWLVINIVSTKQGWFTQAIAPKGNNTLFMSSAMESIKEKSNGNAMFMLVENGKVFDKFSISKDITVNSDTVFGVASLGKWIAAVGIMTLVEAGKLDLDVPVSTYLTRWQLPTSQFDNDGVTIRRLLSHTAGITDGLGHNGFDTKEKIQPLTEHLSQALDIDEGTSGKVLVGIDPGSKWAYSGGSYNLLQLVIEEVSGLSFESYMAAKVFNPLGMNNTGYNHESVNTLAQYFDLDGNVRNYPYYTSLAATGLYTNAKDLLKFVKLHTQTEDQTFSQILSNKTLRMMREPEAKVMGLNLWGAGPIIYTDNNNDDFIVGHGGSSPGLNSTVRVNPETGNAIIMLTTGNRALASDTATQWTLWETGNPDIIMLKNMIPTMIKRFLIGSIAIFIFSIVIVWRRKKPTKTNSTEIITH
jgi:CubicO group peptidase (beta-lactamase class C family)